MSICSSVVSTHIAHILHSSSNTIVLVHLLPPIQSFPSSISRLGALDLEPLKKRKKSHTPRSKSQQAKATKPKEVVNLEEEEESTTKDVARVLEALKKECEKKGRVHYFKFLVDPDSFAHTVENMFHFSFLVKDGRAGVTLGRDGQPYVFIRKSIPCIN